MKQFFKVCIFLMFVGSLSTCMASEGIDGPKIKWRFKTDGPIRGSAVIADNTIYFGSSDGNLYALDKRNGNLIWKFKTEGALVGSPTVLGSSIFIAGRDNYLYHLNADSGKLIWKFKMLPDLQDLHNGWDYYMPAPVLWNNLVMLGSGDGHLYAIDIKSGALQWKFMTKGRIRATALLYKNNIIQPSNDGYVYILDGKRGKLLWKFQTKGATYDPSAYSFDRSSMYAKPLIKDNQLILASRDGNTYSVDINTHKVKWNFNYGTAWAMSTAISDNTVFVGWSSNNTFCALDLLSGKEKWQFKGESHFYTAGLTLDNGVYLGSADGKVYRLDKDTGSKVWEYNIGSEIYSSLIYDSDALFFGSDNGFFYALEEGSAPYKAVYEPAHIEGNTKYLVVDGKITPYLKQKGFEILDDEAKLYTFIAARIRDQKPSVVVFAFPIIPEKVIGSAPDKGMMRQYLATGGKVLWMGDIPNFYKLDEKGDFKTDPSVGSLLLGVEYLDSNEFGNYYSKTTQQGLNWGIPSWLKTTGFIVISKDIIPFGYDEFGRVNYWMKKFSSRPGSGFISFRSWGWDVAIKEQDLDLIYQLAIYGLE